MSRSPKKADIKKIPRLNPEKWNWPYSPNSYTKYKMQNSSVSIALNTYFGLSWLSLTILIFEPDRVRRDVLVVSCVATFIFSSASNGFWDFPTVPIAPPHYFSSLGTRLTTHWAPLHFWPYLSKQMLCYAVSTFLNLVISWRVLSL